MNRRKMLQKITTSPSNVRFADMAGLVEGFGFRLLRVSGSHHIYGYSGISEQINLKKWALTPNRIRFASSSAS